VPDPIVVAFPVWNRPHYLKRVLDSWSRVRGVQDAILEFHCEPGCDEAVELCKGVDFAESYLHVNHERLGHAGNVYSSMNNAFVVTDYAIQALDDMLPSTDLLELHQWHRENYRDDPTVLALTSGRDFPAQGGGLAPVWRCQLIGSLSGFHRAKWDMLAARWGEGAANWWWWVDQEWCQKPGGYDVLFPALSRAEDIGEFGSNPLPEPWAVTQARSCFVADPPPQQYYEVAGRRECGFDRHVEVR
jgi:hypothetical protein